MTDTIAFFGASITQQKTGYAVCLSEKMNIEKRIFGYGGNHLDDAGVCFIDNVLATNPTYCFVDFFSTAYTSENDLTIECLDTIVYRFTKANCKLIFLFFLTESHKERIGFYNFVKAYLDSKKLYYIDMNDHLQFNSELMRDSTHTTEVGSARYAEVLYENFQENKHSIQLPTDIVQTRYTDNVKILHLNRAFTHRVVFEGNCNIIAFYLVIGPKSGKVEINGETHPIWDPWCYYERNHFNIKHVTVKDKMEVNILNDGGQKELNIVSIYYIGDSLNLAE